MTTPAQRDGTHTPLLSVVMAVYNGEPFLGEAVESILTQTFGDFEFIIIDDGSTDGTAARLAAYAAADPRVRVVTQGNQGLIASLNRGCALARGTYIARMDADDISAPERFARQLAHLTAYPEIDVLGTAMQRIDAAGQRLTVLENPVLPGFLRWMLIFHCGISHSSVMFKRTVFEKVGGYDPAMAHVEDYDLWCRMSAFARLENLPDVLLYYRIHGASIGSTKASIMAEHALRVTARMMTLRLNRPVSPEAVSWFSPFHRRHDAGATAAAALLLELYRTAAADPALTAEEHRLIRRDAAQRLSALLRGRMTLGEKAGVLARACCLDPLVMPRRLARRLHARAVPKRT